MTHFRSIALVAATAILSTAPALAQTPAAKAPATMTKTTVVKKPATTTLRTTATSTRTTTTGHGRMVTAKLANGKTVTYDCSKAGNATKTACKK